MDYIHEIGKRAKSVSAHHFWNLHGTGYTCSASQLLSPL